MGTCDNCKHWINSGVINVGLCDSKKWLRGPSNTSLLEIKLDEVLINTKVEGWGFYTGAKFGCIHHEDLSNK